MIKIKDSKGQIFTSDMSQKDDYSILEILFCTSYTSVNVQYPEYDKEDNKKYSTKWVYTKPDNGINNFNMAVDMTAFNEDDEWGEFIND